MVKSAVIAGYLSRTKDRFHEYNEVRSFEERLRMIAAMEDVDGVEAVFPYDMSGPEETAAMLDRYGLRWAAVNVNVKAEPEFRNGGLTSPTRAVREKAVRFIREAKDFAAAAGADKVTCCPLADGYEFSFQCDYSRSWGYLVESLGEAGSYRPEIPLFIEYKPSETRGRCFVDTAAKTLCLLSDIGVAEMGVTIDFGHSVYGGENPAEAVSLVARSRYPMYIHINDNDGRWDWDYFVGTKHLLEYIEFLFYLRKHNYDDYFTSDTSPTRWDIARTFEANARITNKLWNLLERVGDRALAALLDGDDYLSTWEFIEKNLLSL